MHLIGISGKKQSGKDTVSNFITELLPDKKCSRIAFADSLYDEVSKCLGISVDYIKEHKASFRLILQGYGADYRRALTSEDYWVVKWLNKVKDLSSDTYCLIVPDVRYRNEYDTIKKAGGHVIRVNRNNSSDDTHSSEVEMDNELFDYIIQNDKSLNDLHWKTRDMLYAMRIWKHN